LNSWKKNTIN